MYSKLVRNKIKNSFTSKGVNNETVNYFSRNSIKSYTAPATDSVSYVDKEWNNALPFKKLPGLTKWQFLKEFSSGGKYHNMDFIEVTKQFHRDFGDIMIFPGLFGNSGFVFVYDPNDFEKVRYIIY